MSRGDPQLFDGFDVVGNTYAVLAGDVELQGQGADDVLEYQDTRWLLVKVRCAKVLHEPAAKDNKDPMRVHKLAVEHARVLGDDEVATLAAQGNLST